MNERIRLREKSYDELGFTDDFLFCRILLENEDICIELVEMITGRKVEKVVHSETQKAIRLTHDGRGVRFDVYFFDEYNVVYDIEMQTSRKYNIPKRTRYYQGMIDMNLLSKGEDYEKLRESYLIFICTYDEFSAGRHIYTFENCCLEDPSIRMNDGAHKIFLCTAGNQDDCSEQMKEFLDYIAGNEAASTFTKRLQEEVKKSKKQEKWRLDYMTLMEKYREKIEEGRQIGLEEGLEQGIEQGRFEGEKERQQLSEEIERLRTELEQLKMTSPL